MDTKVQLEQPKRGRPKGDKLSVQNVGIAKRRNLIALMYLTGTHTIYTIKEVLESDYAIKISAVSIANDIKAMRVEWQAAALRTTHEHVTTELAKLADLERFAFDNLANNFWTKEKYVLAVLRITKRRSAMLGLDKATKLEVVDKRTSELDDADLEAIIIAANTAKKGEKKNAAR